MAIAGIVLGVLGILGGVHLLSLFVVASRSTPQY